MIISKIAGGAQMFQIKSENSIMQIGKRNVEAVKAKLSQLRIKILAEDVEGNYGRTIEFFCETGELTIKTIEDLSMNISYYLSPAFTGFMYLN
jgi:chemotaxis protein CheD